MHLKLRLRLLCDGPDNVFNQAGEAFLCDQQVVGVLEAGNLSGYVFLVLGRTGLALFRWDRRLLASSTVCEGCLSGFPFLSGGGIRGSLPSFMLAADRFNLCAPLLCEGMEDARIDFRLQVTLANCGLVEAWS